MKQRLNRVTVWSIQIKGQFWHADIWVNLLCIISYYSVFQIGVSHVQIFNLDSLNAILSKYSGQNGLLNFQTLA